MTSLAACTEAIPAPLLEAKVREALEEDLGPGGVDVTSEAVVPASLQADALIIAKAEGVLAGAPAAVEVFRQVDPAVRIQFQVDDGARVVPGTPVATVAGSLRGVLRAERTALNFLQQLSGVATLTRRYVDAAPGVTVLNTRKTVPGLRAFQRYAVAVGGGTNHRRGLSSAVLIKDNHVAAAGGVSAALARTLGLGLPVEIEVDTLEQLDEVLAAGPPEVVLLDNMPVDTAAEAVRRVAGRTVLEVSGGVTLATVGAYAATGVDRISIGELTHSAPALDLSLEVTL
ncbi:MAG: carboxylating nicotinate-nucleotide diphosphorylase [Candidatus Dormibacteraeota bacterium]|nr:carboxylating nicotinate-nucleotide diphosphorylase [Candidatus Dormibacteraeota bacterium]